MNRLIAFCLMCLALSIPSVASANEPPAIEHDKDGPTWTVQVDPLTTYLGYVHLQIEHAFTPHFSLYAGPHLRLFNAPGVEPEDYKGYGVELGARWYPFGTAPEGFWTLVRGVGARISTDTNATFGGYVSGLAGYTAIFADTFVLSGGAGIQYLHYHIDGLGPKRVFIALHTSVGFAF